MEQQIPITDITPELPKVTKVTPTVREELPEPIREVSEKVSKAIREFQESETYEKILNAKDKAGNYIKDNPVNSFFYALGAGLFLGLILKRNK
ncbi:MAG: hypothetical protein HGB22_04775 [Chlorobiaceae bacterium]|nr:hypothetical protein [Chlorobiaceae bacterium]